jgi:GNAT superfamily N-acetyltransferase
MTVAIRPIAGDEADLVALLSVVNEVSSEDGTSLEEIRWSDATYPGTGRFLAELDGRPVGAGTAGRIWMRAPEFDGAWASIDVRPSARRRGVGSALYEAVSRHARATGKRALHIETYADRPDAIEFLLHRGFRELERSQTVALDLRGRAAPTIEPPAGVSITTLAERPDLVEGIFRVAEETFSDIPGAGGPMRVGSLSEFRARDVDRPGIPPAGFAIAMDETDGRVIGYASLILQAATRTKAYHDMTAVVRGWRGRGVAAALKRATIAWAIAAGLERLETGNDVANIAMRAVNARLGYQPLADAIEYRGPLAGETAVAAAG